MLFARLKGGVKEFRKVLDANSEPEFDYFPEPDTSSAQEYAPLQTDIDRGSWQFITLEQDNIEEMLEPYTTNPPMETPILDVSEYNLVDVLYRVHGGKILFKKLGAADKIHENGKQIISFTTQDIIIERSSFGIDFNGVADAVYETASRKLFFTSFMRAKPMFKGIDIFYQDDTLEEKEAFLDNSLFSVGDFNLNFISLADTKRLADIRESEMYDFNDPDTQSRIRAYANAYPSAGVGIDNEGKVMIDSKRDLRALLKLLEQKFFTSEITGEKLEATRTKRMAR